MRPQRHQHAPKAPTKADARDALLRLLAMATPKSLHTFLTVESLTRTTGLPEQEVRVKLDAARLERPYP